MPITRRGFLNMSLTAGALALTGTARSTSAPPGRWYLFGTLVDLSIREQDPVTASEASSRLRASLETVSREWNAWKPGTLSTVNAAIARGEPVWVDRALAGLIADARGLERVSGGLFNPALGRAVGVWGFHSDGSPRRAPSGRAQPERLVADTPSLEDLSMDAGVLRSRNAAVQLDFGGYAKGRALDRGIAMLQARGIGDALIDAGGDVCALGRDGDRPWRVAVRDARGRGVLAWVETEGKESVYTSGRFGRHLEAPGRRYVHVLDPKTGRPAREVASVTVLHADGGLADAASTALAAAGPEGWTDTAAAMGIDHAMLVDVRGRVQLTRAMAQRVSLAGVSARALSLV